MTKRLPAPAPGEKYWLCELSFFDLDYKQPCPRCGKPCQWVTRVVIYPRGPISRGTLHGPVCPCPDDHIRKAIANILAEVLLKDLREHPPDV